MNFIQVYKLKIKKAFKGISDFTPEQQLIYKNDMLKETYRRTLVVIILVSLIQISNLLVYTDQMHANYAFLHFYIPIGLFVINLIYLTIFIIRRNQIENHYKLYNLVIKSYWFLLMAGSIIFSFVEMKESHTIENFTLYILALGIVPFFGMVEVVSLILIYLAVNIIMIINIGTMQPNTIQLMVVLAVLSFYAAITQYIFTFDVFVEKQNLARTNKKLELLSETDQLTGLFNRRGMEKQLYRLKFGTGDNIDLSMLLIDVDYFKAYNDKYFHAKGDQCLIKIADCLNSNPYFDDDIVVRYGGEEFLIISRNIDDQKIIEHALNVKNAIHDLHIPFDKNEDFPYITVSIGLATKRFDNQCASINSFLADLFDQADKELYNAKNNGRNCISFANFFYR